MKGSDECGRDGKVLGLSRKEKVVGVGLSKEKVIVVEVGLSKENTIVMVVITLFFFFFQI